MSYNRSSALESQPTTWRREDDAEYADDPEFQRFSSELSDRIFQLTSIVSRLSNEVAHLGTRRETPRVRERVKDLIEDGARQFKDVGDGLKKVISWPDVGVRNSFWSQNK
jgi:syntaxin-like protein